MVSRHVNDLHRRPLRQKIDRLHSHIVPLLTGVPIVFLQPLHSEALLVDECSMRIQRLPSPVAKSVWTDEQGYASRRQCKSFVYDEKYGLKNVIYTVIPE